AGRQIALPVGHHAVAGFLNAVVASVRPIGIGVAEHFPDRHRTEADIATRVRQPDRPLIAFLAAALPESLDTAPADQRFFFHGPERVAKHGALARSFFVR